MISFTWPGPLPDLDGWPRLQVTVTTPRDQADLHRGLGHLGYVPEVQAEGDGVGPDVYRFTHPDGPRR